MKIVIDIPDEAYELLKNKQLLDNIAESIIANGTPYEDRPQGEWITWEEAGNYIASPNRHECSCCHDSAQVLVNGIELLSDFCPNCGADMRVKDELGGRG